MKTSKLELKTRDALRKQSNVATLNLASLVTRRQQVASTKKSVVGGGGLKGVGSDFASACSCEHGEAKFKPPPPLQQSKKQPQTVVFYSKNLIYNTNFNQTKFSIFRMQVWAHKFKIRSKNLLKTTLFRRRNRCRYVIISRIFKSRRV